MITLSISNGFSGITLSVDSGNSYTLDAKVNNSADYKPHHAHRADRFASQHPFLHW